MTAKRYFYTDPLAAAWMAKHHGMVFVEPGFDEGLGSLSDNYFCNGSVWIFPERIYIRPDILHLLEPNASTDLTLNGIAEGVGMEKRESNRIIQRNGIPFHWPESEP